jgi:hypothetical protein
MGKKLTQSEFIAQIEKRNIVRPPITPLEPYKKSTVKMRFRCSCGREYLTTPSNANRSNGCAVCIGKSLKTQ